MENSGLFLSSPNSIGLLLFGQVLGESASCISFLLMIRNGFSSLKKKKKKILHGQYFSPLFRFDAVLVLVGYIIKCTYEHVNFMVLIFFNGTVGFGNNKRV